MKSRRIILLISLLILAIGYGMDTFCFAADAETAQKIAELEAFVKQQLAAKQESLDHMWTMIAAALVTFMQGGFLLLEAGMVRSKNSINVAQKNITDFVFACILFYLVGFMLMFGPTIGGWVGYDEGMLAWNLVDDWNYTFFIFQMVFCGTSATILSGAVAERMKYSAYLIIVAVISCIIYPIFGHWAWGNLFVAENTSYLMDKGFIDFAGSTVVHSVGGWIALAGIIVLGPRIGKYNADGSTNILMGHSYVLATLGAIILWIGWMGFNGGSTTVGSPSFAHIISNTMIAAAFGGAIATIMARAHEGIFRPDRSINGILGGLVGITAGCDAVSTHHAITIGLICGFIVYYVAWFMEEKLKLDDAIGAVPVHGVCGALGTILAGVFCEASSLCAASRWEQIQIQCEGVALGFVWAFGVAFIAFKLLDITIGCRVTAEEEEMGLNAAEHGASLGTGALQDKIKYIFEGDLTMELDTSSGDEAAEMAMVFNAFVAKVRTFINHIKKNSSELNTSSAQLAQVAGEITHTSEQLSSQSCEASDSTNKVFEKMDSTSANINNITSDISTISTNASEMSENIDSMYTAVEELTSAIKEISVNTVEVNDATTEANQMTENAMETMESLNNASEHIKSMLAMIKDIANKTNLISLNASIEAARAGEAGKAFSVVAGEVKKLANQAADATDQIEKRINVVNTSIGDVSTVMMDISKIINIINKSMNSVTVSANEQRNTAVEISAALKETSVKSNEMASKIENISIASSRTSKDLEDIANETDNLTQNVNNFSSEANQTSQNAEDLESNASKLSRMSKKLNAEVSEFKTE